MNSILKLRESDPHDDFAIAPDIVPATWADKVLADIESDSKTPSGSRRPDQPPLARTAAARGTGSDFREVAAGDFKVPEIDILNERPAGQPPDGSRLKKGITVLLFALCSALAAASWHHYGAAAKQMISAWVPPFVLTSPVRPEPTGLTAPSATADASSSAQGSTQVSASDQAAAQTADAAAPTPAAALSPDPAQLQSMARDLAAMGQEVALLKATIAELKAGQAMAAKSADAKPESKPAEARAAVLPRPKMSTPPPPPRAAPVAARRPMPAYSAYPPVQAAAPPPQQVAPPPGSLQSTPPPPAMTQADDDPVVRPPMPLR